MIETMRGAKGAGQAAPQVGRRLRLFVADLLPAWRALPPDERPEIPPQPMACINPAIVWASEEEAEFEEGCLSIPGVDELVRRPKRVTLRHLDRDSQPQELEGVGFTALVLQHESDHLDGVLHVHHLSSLRKRLIKGHLRRIARGDFDAAYPMQIGDRPQGAT